MTTDRVALRELLEKGSDVDLPRAMIGYVAQRLMDPEVGGLACAAAPGTASGRPPARTNQRDGYRDRLWDTRAGSIELQIPKPRKGSCFPGLLEPRRTAEKALAAVIQEAYVQGVSTRSVDGRSGQGHGHDRDQQAPGLAPVRGDRRGVDAFLERPIEGEWPYLWIAWERRSQAYVKVREAGRTVPVAGMIAVAVSADGRREVLGMAVGPSEAEPSWTAFLRSLMHRGLRGVELVISDAIREGLKAAAAKVLGATWQRCRAHFLRSALAHAGPSQRAMAAAAIRTAFAQESPAAAHRRWRQVADGLRERFPKLAALMEEAEHDVLAYLGFHPDPWAKISSAGPRTRSSG